MSALMNACAQNGGESRKGQLDFLDHLVETDKGAGLGWGGEYDPKLIDEEQLRSVLLKLRPKLRADATVVGHVDHNLRFWGAEAAFDDGNYVSGEQMRKFLLDHNRFRQVYAEHNDEEMRELVSDHRRFLKPKDDEIRLDGAANTKLRELWHKYTWACPTTEITGYEWG